jgi:hypothetical protein
VGKGRPVFTHLTIPRVDWAVIARLAAGVKQNVLSDVVAAAKAVILSQTRQDKTRQCARSEADRHSAACALRCHDDRARTKLKPARARLKTTFPLSSDCAALAWKNAELCFSHTPISLRRRNRFQIVFKAIICQDRLRIKLSACVFLINPEPVLANDRFSLTRELFLLR